MGTGAVNAVDRPRRSSAIPDADKRTFLMTADLASGNHGARGEWTTVEIHGGGTDGQRLDVVRVAKEEALGGGEGIGRRRRGRRGRVATPLQTLAFIRSGSRSGLDCRHTRGEEDEAAVAVAGVKQVLRRRIFPLESENVIQNQATIRKLSRQGAFHGWIPIVGRVDGTTTMAVLHLPVEVRRRDVPERPWATRHFRSQLATRLSQKNVGEFAVRQSVNESKLLEQFFGLLQRTINANTATDRHEFVPAHVTTSIVHILEHLQQRRLRILVDGSSVP
mmetsp:Transcript_5834/g.11168  ORF Transcript_5834/g.11168 Transcript_5834/m.11168 type:complete len:277 (-) Transcript_5834:301-1131(-)